MTDPDARHYVYLIPGLFGFGQLAGYDYFAHLERAIAERFAAAGIELALHVVPTPPTASIAVRAAMVASTVARTAGSYGPIHLVGHSTGGLDARLLLSPGLALPLANGELDWTQRVRRVLAINTPHYGTPLASYFTTVAGTRLLYALSLLTVTTLSVGRLPLTALSVLLAAIEGAERRMQIEIRLLDALTSQVLRFVDERGRAEIGDYLRHVRSDQGGIIQLMPEVMELFNAAVKDNPAVRYGCIASAGPPPGARRVFSAMLSPVAALQLAVYTTVYGVASHGSDRYPYATPTPSQSARLSERLGTIGSRSVDGIVPTLSMLWGELVWCGHADHLDVVGHFADARSEEPHVDWLASGAHFRPPDFAAMSDALCGFLLG
jgi:triacylglycerol esterase/lipase EstA (alpha/beta hydrolase family)